MILLLQRQQDIRNKKRYYKLQHLHPLDLRISTIAHTLNKKMENNLFPDTKGICLVCAGFQGGECFCFSLLESAPKFISNHQQPETQKTSLTPHYKRLKKDNIALKRFTTILKKIYRKITGKEIDNDLNQQYFRKDFFIMILNLFQREGKLEEGFSIYLQDMEAFKMKIIHKHQVEPEYLGYLKSLIQTHVEAFARFKNREVRSSLKIIYNYEDMRHRNKFKFAERKVLQMRKDMGLPFQEE